MNIYLAASLSEEHRKDMYSAIKILRDIGHNVHAPVEHKVPNDWDYPNSEWGLMVFEMDVDAIQRADLMVMLCYGRNTTAGTCWEAGYAYGIGKKVIVVEMATDIMSLMVANGRYATVCGLEGLAGYDFKNLPMTRTDTEQK